jgi:hypothetical protein
LTIQTHKPIRRQTATADKHYLFPDKSFWKKESQSGRLQQAYIGWQVGLQLIF